MTTRDVLDLVEEVLRSFPKPYSADIIDQVCMAICGSPDWLQRYEHCVEIHGKHVVNNMLGRYVFKLSGPSNPEKLNNLNAVC